jgi:hypothetical protein
VTYQELSGKTSGASGTEKMKLLTKLYGTVGTLAFIGMTVAGSGYWYLQSIGGELSTATDQTAVRLDHGNAALGRVWEMIAADRGMFVSMSLKDMTTFEARVQQWDSRAHSAHNKTAKARGQAPSRPSRSADHGEPVLAGRNAGKNVFPLDDQFREF